MTTAIEPTAPRSTRGFRIVVGAALALHAVLGLHSAASLSVTHDEFWHLPVGLLNLRTGRFDYDNLNPPLIRMLAAAPLLAASARLDAQLSDHPADYGDAFLEQNGGRYPLLLWMGRGVIVLLSSGAGLLLAVWARELFGDRAGGLAAVLWAFEPNLIAHGSLVTTDLGAAACFVFVTYAVWRFARQTTWNWALTVGLLLGLAQLVKFTCLILYPIALGCYLLGRKGQPAGVPPRRRQFEMWLSAIVLSLLVLNAGYLFRGTFSSLGSIPLKSLATRSFVEAVPWIKALPLPFPRDYLAGLDHQKEVMEQQHPVYLNGEWSKEGFPHYYLWAMLIKIPLPLWLLVLVALISIVLKPPKARRLSLQALILLPAAMMVWAAEASTMQLGVRYVLPAIPFLILFASQSAEWLALKPLRPTGIAMALLVLAMIASVRFHPNHLAYFNELGGGPIDGRQRLADSNLDWGQDLNRVKPFMEQHGIDEIGLAYFGTPKPADFGIRYRVPPRKPELGWYAISVNYVQARPHTLRMPSGAPRAVNMAEFAYFQQFKPVARLGYSIDVYHVRPEDLVAFQKALREAFDPSRLPIPVVNLSSKKSSPIAAQLGAPRDGGVWLALLLGIGLTYAFWTTLWHGGGIIGGDTYTYFFPQKTFFAAELKQGRLPTWCHLVGHGYPLLAESQTGVFYPPNLVLYSIFPVNAAYSAQQIAHYVLAFVACWLLARRLGLGNLAAYFASLVYVYGWFPQRICLEWAIIGGCYFPFLLWCVESYLQLRRPRYLVAASAALGMFLLAGHYNLAFISVFAALAYTALRLLCGPREETTAIARARPLASITIAIGVGFAIAAAQLLPTWELKRNSQRSTVGGAYDPGYGHLPPWYLSQIATPWMWYAPDVDADQALNSTKLLSIPSATNKVEAHLYFGLLPLALVVVGWIVRIKKKERLSTPLRILCALGLFGVAYATGWLLPIMRHVPGFGFFSGPGRYGILAALAMALIAGATFDRLIASPRLRNRRLLLFTLFFAATAFDFWVVRIHWNRTAGGNPNWYADFVDDPPIVHLDESAFRKLLAARLPPARVFAPGANLPTIIGVAMVPQYLGIGPSEYFEPALKLPQFAGDDPTPDEVRARDDWLRRAGVTHIFAQQRLDGTSRPVRPVAAVADRVLNPAMARAEPLYLYELIGGRGRVSWQDPRPGDKAEVKELLPERVTVEADSRQGGLLILTDLFYPGWNAYMDGQPIPQQRVDGMYRGVELPAGTRTVVWRYEPRIVTIGLVISGVTIAALAAFSIIVWRRKPTLQH